MEEIPDSHQTLEWTMWKVSWISHSWILQHGLDCMTHARHFPVLEGDGFHLKTNNYSFALINFQKCHIEQTNM